MALYPFQEKVYRLLAAGRSVILQAPTGAGKTRAALYPFLRAWEYNMDFPRKCIYSVPMRVLANQFWDEYEARIRNFRFERSLKVFIQTGERAEDPQLEGDLIFTTIDQTLSSFLNLPYALSGRKANLNAGAIVSAYLVFDEFHLFPHDKGSGALPATVQMLRLLRGLVPFVLMTATFSGPLLTALAEQLEAEVVVVPPEELREIDTRRNLFPPRQRSLHLRLDQCLRAADVLETHQARSLAVCNTVERASELFDGLIAEGCRSIPFNDPAMEPYYVQIATTYGADKQKAALDAALERLREIIQARPDWSKTTWVMLLHARFEQPHRAVKEEFARRMFGPSEERPWELPSLILTATQVIEVGLNLTGECLHTEMAPANSILQRAGRCARFPGETGEVYIYAVPLNKKEEPNYLPYPSDLCEQSREALTVWDGKVVDFTAEQEIINTAHGEHDRAMLQRMRDVEGWLWGRMEDAVVHNDMSVRRDLIRNTVDSRTVLVYEPPARLTEESPYWLQGFSLYHGTLRGKFETLRAWAEELDLAWSLKYPIARGEEADSREPTVYEWLDVESEDDISASLVFTVHPQLVAYDAERGFRFVPPEAGEGGHYASPIPAKGEKTRSQYTYELESYPDHIRAMIRLYERDLRYSLAYVGKRLEEHPQLRLLPGALDRAIRLAIALHDVGKLQVGWQQWARKYQQAIGAEVPDYLVAHTLSQTEAHQEMAKKIKPGRPNHAGEGAMASLRILGHGLERKAELTFAALTAIARHHSPQLTFENSKGFKLHPQAGETIRAALAEAGCDATLAQYLLQECNTPLPDKYLLGGGQWLWWLVYFLIVRVVRLTDGKSQASD